MGTPHEPSPVAEIPHDMDASGFNRSIPVPKMDFPKFNGENPRWWLDHCVLYFEVYGIPSPMKTRFAALNFQGAAAAWLQTVQHRGRITDWDKMCELVFAKFDKDQYQNQLCQLESLKQSGSVQECYEQFEKLAHGVLLYNPMYDDVYFVTRFLTGLKEEIRAAITLHRPQDVDTASALALLQEEELANSKTRFLGRGFTKNLSTATKSVAKSPTVDTDDKVASLKQFRRKNGLCFKCGGKWALNHTCPEQVPIHVLEELWDALEIQTTDDLDEVQSELVSTDETVMAVQEKIDNAKARRQTLKLLAQVGKQQVLVLVDPGSIDTFVSEQLVWRLALSTEQCQQAMFKAADGGQLPCSERVPSFEWCVQGHTFVSDARVLDLRCYDMIVGEDWLEAVSPVWVNYKTKEMRITHKGKRVALQGVQDHLETCREITPKKLDGLFRSGGVFVLSAFVW